VSLRQHPVVWVGLAVVLGAAAVLSFVGLRDLAVAVGLGNLDGQPSRLAWLLPVSVDAGAAVSCAVWLSGRANEAAEQFARRMTYALLVTTVAGQALHLGMHALHADAPWWLAVAVGAIPPAVVGGCVHLAVLTLRQDTPAPASSSAAVDSSGSPACTNENDAGSLIEDAAMTHLEQRARDLIAEAGKPLGRPTLAAQLGIKPHGSQARELMQRLNGSGAS